MISSETKSYFNMDCFLSHSSKKAEAHKMMKIENPTVAKLSKM